MGKIAKMFLLLGLVGTYNLRFLGIFCIKIFGAFFVTYLEYAKKGSREKLRSLNFDVQREYNHFFSFSVVINFMGQKSSGLLFLERFLVSSKSIMGF